MLGYRVPAPDQAMLISGGKQKAEGAQFRVVIGHGAWVMPGFRKCRFLGLDLHKVDIEETCRSTEGILLNLKAVVAFKVQSDVPSVNAAAQRFLGEQKKGQMEEMTNRIFAGHLRSIVGAMTVIDIHRNRDALAQNILEHSQLEMSRLGLTVDSLQIEHLDDSGVGYLDNLAAPHLADAERDAAIARANASQESEQAVQENERKKADQVRQTVLKRAGIKSETDKADAEAAQAGPLAKAKAEQQVLAMQAETAQRSAELRQQQLVAEVQKPAEAAAAKVKIEADAQAAAAEAQARQLKVSSEAQAASDVVMAEAAAKQVELAGSAEARRVRAIGLAQAESQKAQADAMAANDRAQLEQLRINIMPEVARAIASGLSGSNLTVLNGAEGLSNIAASLLQQGRLIFESFNSQANGQVDNTTSVSEALNEIASAR